MLSPTLIRSKEILSKQQLLTLSEISIMPNFDFDSSSMLQTIVDAISDKTKWFVVGIVIIDEDRNEVWFAAQQ